MSKKAPVYCNYTYKCLDCNKMFHERHSTKQKGAECPICEKICYLILASKLDCAPSKCGFLSVDTVTKQNLKRVGNEQYQKMCDADPVISARRKGREQDKKAWWRKGEKPLDLKTVKDVKRYIATGEKD